MIWATVSSQSCFCWGYRASPSLAANNIINLISVLTIWWCPRIESCVVGRGCLLWPVCSLGKSLLAFALIHSIFQGWICLLIQVFLDFLLLHSQRRQWHPTPVLLPGKSHGWRSLVGCSPWSCEELDTTERIHFPFSLSCLVEGNGNSLQCSCLENPKDGGAW